MCGAALLARRLAIDFQDGVDERNQRPDYPPLALDTPALRRLSVRQCLPNHPPMNSQLARHSLDSSDAELVFPSNLLE
jgi:hypothetical protein